MIKRFKTKIQYRSGMRLADETSVYEVVSSMDLGWLLGEEGDYLTVLRKIGTLSTTKKGE